MQRTINKLVDGQHLDKEEAQEAMSLIMTNRVTPVQVAAFITALRMKGETAAEITGCALAMRDAAIAISAKSPVVLDTCGTGGDRLGTFNISTAAAFVVAGAGVTVAKHGNRSVSSKCGSADVLEALGVRVDLIPKQVEKCLAEVGIGFFFAPTFHHAMKFAAGPRRELGFRSIFNLLGPLTNPAAAGYQVVGVYRRDVAPILAQVLLNMGSQRAMVVHGEDGMDELTLTGATYISETHDGDIINYQVTPEMFGLTRCLPEEVSGGTAKDNAIIIRQIFSGEGNLARRQIVLLNAAAALYVCGKAKDLHDGIRLAAEVIEGGKALAVLDRLTALSITLPNPGRESKALGHEVG
ncbi:anthranilate phosphoribosyltransferase [Metallumcola ferriviriculae]|uniref:Anthranilate phosphoribosyltransferase n=1 Tax=Metallumcola ferriviriculae TaxID=3039180 RepID=A0AAU0UKQ3_9FIRM|nr:anthranilate phosphoribosyltransferase [Desulfitibacteraceae bacterium MK1]